MENKEKKIDYKSLEHRVLEGTATETIQRYGSAVKQHCVSYSGFDNEEGTQLKKSLESISKHKLSSDPKWRDNNIKQQAGFTAEVKVTAKRNAENIINKNANRISRTDDLGMVNHPLYDLVEIDESGNIILGSGSQMKFVGSSPEALLSKLNGKKFQKYIDSGAILDIADDDYDALIGINGKSGIIDKKIEALQKQIEDLENTNKFEVIAKKKQQIIKYEKIKEKLRKTGLTRDEAIKARMNPKLSVVKDVTEIAHKAGKEQAKYGAIISGSVSLVKNMTACIKGEKEVTEVALDVAKDTARGGAISYGSAFLGSLLKGGMQNSKSLYIRGLSKTNLAGTLVTSTLDIGRTMKKYIKGDITGAECFEMLGEHGVGEIGAAMFSAVGVATVGSSASTLVSVLAGMTGATFGYAAATAVYQELATSLKEAQFAKEERIRIERECEEAIQLIIQYRNEMNEIVSKFLIDHYRTFEVGFIEMDKAIQENDINGFIRGNVTIQEILGKEIQFRTQQEFDSLMLSDEKFIF